jgi:phage terminase large subunit-like protein
VKLEAFAERCGIKLEPFQKRIARAIDGPEHECVILLPRGCGKTHLSALIALHHLLQVEDAEIFCAASSERQARILFEAAAAYARTLGDPHIVPRYRELRWCPDPDEPKVFTRSLRVLAADPAKLHGLTYSLAFLDELQVFTSNDNYEALTSGLHKRPDAKLVVISTAGQGADSPLGRLRARALAQPRVTRRGAVTDARGPSLRLLEWSCSEDDDLDRPRVVKRANPASWISLEQLREQRERLPDLAFRRFVANQWTAKAGHWLPAGAWQACAGKPEFQDGERIWLGVDIGGERADSAVVWVNERLQVGCEVFSGDGAVLEVAALIPELAERYTIAEVAFDPWRAGQIARELEQRGIPVFGLPPKRHPHDPRLSAAL